jgi:hypothetical protein
MYVLQQLLQYKGKRGGKGPKQRGGERPECKKKNENKDKGLKGKGTKGEGKGKGEDHEGEDKDEGEAYKCYSLLVSNIISDIKDED